MSTKLRLNKGSSARHNSRLSNRRGSTGFRKFPVQCSASSPRQVPEDPEAKYRRYGQYFGKRPNDFQNVVESAPRVRVRRARDRARDQLADLAVLNARLAGDDETQVAHVRQRLDYLRSNRRNWELVYQMIAKDDALCTLNFIEEASRKAEALLSQRSQDTTGVQDMEAQLKELESEVSLAKDKLQKTQRRVKENLERVEQLREEATVLEAAAAIMDRTASISKQMRDAKRRGLQSSLDLEPGLKNHWFPVSFSSKLAKDMLIPITLFEEQWVLFRDVDGMPSCVKDECAHRACPLSLGKIVDGQVECAYHGWRFNGDGDCTKMPSTVLCRGIAVQALPILEKDGFVWVWPGSSTPAALPASAAPPSGYEVHTEIELEVPVEHGLLVENLLDLAHAPFTHTSTFARGWPVPEIVKFHAGKVLAGDWDPYPIQMSFEPPCITISTIGLKRPGNIVRGGTAESCDKHLHQMHVCLPSTKGNTRLLYRMSMDFMGWAKYVPGVQSLWKSVAGQVLGEDLRLVLGQQDRMLAGGDTWANPVSYDKLAVRYRRWRNSLEGEAPLEQQAKTGSTSMSADELFKLDGSCDASVDECELFRDV